MEDDSDFCRGRACAAARVAAVAVIARHLKYRDIIGRIERDSNTIDPETGHDGWIDFIDFDASGRRSPANDHMIAVAGWVSGNVIDDRYSLDFLILSFLSLTQYETLSAAEWAYADVEYDAEALVPAIKDVSALLRGELKALHLQTAARLVQIYKGEYFGPLFDPEPDARIGRRHKNVAGADRLFANGPVRNGW